MPVTIDIKKYGNKKNENQAAQELKQRFENDFRGKSVKGRILIASSVQLFGGSVRDLDIVVLGKLEGYTTTLNTKVRNKNNLIFGPSQNKIDVRDFCFILELKDHDARHLSYDNFALYAEYEDSTRNVTEQSEDQKYALKNFIIRNSKSKVPTIVNLIWLRQVDDLSRIPGAENKNILSSSFTFDNLLETAINCEEKFLPKSDGDKYILSSYSIGFPTMEKLFEYFGKEKERLGNITRKKVQLITQNEIDKNISKIDADKKMVALRGLAGTGKTSMLLRIAYRLQQEKNARCLILTYNRALVGDIKRLLAFADVSDRLDGRTANIESMQGYFSKLMKSFSTDLDIHISSNNFQGDYNKGLNKLIDYISENLINEDDIKEKKRKCPELSWSYILIDEGQDWDDREKAIIMKFYKDDHLIVADGIDQMVRGNIPQNWLADLNKEQFSKIDNEICLRQKQSLTTFSNELASRLGLKWEVKKNAQGLKGGETIVLNDNQLDNHIQRIVKQCQDAGNELYDFMILVPPSLVNRDKNGQGQYSDVEKLKDLGYGVFDGTNDSIRCSYGSVNQIRVYQYDSCRGLEGWTVVCRNFDEFIDYKYNDYVVNKRDVEDPLVLDTFEDRQKLFVKRWVMMAITRPIDTLVITINNSSSKIANILRGIAADFNDSITCKI